MFTGLVAGQGLVLAVTPEGPGRRFRIQFPPTMLGASTAVADAPQPLVMGESIAINGCCLTVVAMGEDWADFQAGSETLSRTNLHGLTIGQRANLERSLALGDRLGGHIVQGHVDAVGRVHAILPEGDWIHMWFEFPAEWAGLIVPKGSVAIDGVSLTAVAVERTRFSVALIPHTLAETTLGTRQVGDPVNLEFDILGKYVSRLLESRLMTQFPSGHTDSAGQIDPTAPPV